MPTFCSNYLCNVSSETLNYCTQLLLRYFSQALTKDTFKDSTCGERQVSVSNMDQTLKSIELRSGDEGGHNSMLQNRRKLSLHQPWVLLEVWEGAPACWMMTSSFLKWFFIPRKAGVKISSMYTFVLTLVPCFTKIEEISSFWHCSPNHARCCLLVAING